MTKNALLEKGPKNSGMGRPSPPPSFGQCPKENVFFLLMSSLSPNNDSPKVLVTRQTCMLAQFLPWSLFETKCVVKIAKKWRQISKNEDKNEQKHACLLLKKENWTHRQVTPISPTQQNKKLLKFSKIQSWSWVTQWEMRLPNMCQKEKSFVKCRL